MAGYWIDDPANPFNQMSYTRGGGGYDNSSTHESNAARAFAMQGSGTGALPRYADTQTAQSVLSPGSLAVVGDQVIKTTAKAPSQVGSGAGAGTAATGSANGGSGAGAEQVATKPTRTAGAGSTLTIQPGGAPLTMGTSDKGTELFVGGDWFKSNPWFSDVEEWEARYGEPGEWLGGAVVIGADVVYNIGRGVDALTGTRIVSPRNTVPVDTSGPGMSIVQSTLEEVGDAFVREDARMSQQLHRHFNTGIVIPMGGF